MTPTQLELHQAHKTRQMRIASAAQQFRMQKRASVVTARQIVAERTVAPEIKPKARFWFSIEGDAPIPTIENIQLIVADHYGVTRSEILSPRREARIILPRHIGYYLSKKLTGHPLTVIGRKFGGRDHTTILACVRKMTARLAADAELRSVVDAIEAKFMVSP